MAAPQTKRIYGWDAKANRSVTIGHASIPSRPHWLPYEGPGQQNVDPLCWSLSIEQWIFFVRQCSTTDTWRQIKEAKRDEYAITMYDICEHFVKPWTAGTGCSLALLMNGHDPQPSEGMLSHSWAGSVVETYNCLQNMVNHFNVDSTARFFYCTFSMYQPEDGLPGGLSIPEQIALEPFAKIIESTPKYGMFVVHTTTSEVYDRLWVAHEADVGIHANLPIKGLFDIYRWTSEKFELASAINTKMGKVGEERDRLYIEKLIKERGGYERLDQTITAFRQTMMLELKAILNKEPPPPGPVESEDSVIEFDLGSFRRGDAEVTFSWTTTPREQHYTAEIEWDFLEQWAEIQMRVYSEFFSTSENMKRLVHYLHELDLQPLGKNSSPFRPIREVVKACDVADQRRVSHQFKEAIVRAHQVASMGEVEFLGEVLVAGKKRKAWVLRFLEACVDKFGLQPCLPCCPNLKAELLRRKQRERDAQERSEQAYGERHPELSDEELE